MSKYSDSPDFPTISVGAQSSQQRKASFTDTDHAIASVVKVMPGSNGSTSGTGVVIATIRTDQGSLKRAVVSPMNPHMFTIPLPNEKIHCIRDSQRDEWYYTGIASDHGMVNHLPIAHNLTLRDGDTSVPYTGETFVSLPRSARSVDLYEGDVIMQGRFGQSLRFTGANPNTTAPWISSTNSTSPITILRNGYLPTEDFETDAAGIWLTTDQYLEIPLQADMPAGLQPTRDKFGSGQVIIYSDRVVIGSRSADIILSSKKTIALCTQLWAHDVDVVLDTLEALVEQVKKLTAEVKAQALASSQQVFPTPVGPSGLSVQAPRYASSFSNSITIESSLMDIKTKLGALKQK
tara:strand:+ start:6296 stop:7342 length:1047 start_codon:yes stop_codon:yes gene_type:complete